ncbi:hypothetical protein C6Y14_30040 [Streptomyces dioscori]|uniref:Uncharacterized protein n=1 Tax=Streptomyces dioscori TaxID=2109333 RepID=A0A2P8Q0F2_9ACTN|nr:hypothetical protein C6Y14_30040 [Streptomyces dioscori]
MSGQAPSRSRPPARGGGPRSSPRPLRGSGQQPKPKPTPRRTRTRTRTRIASVRAGPVPLPTAGTWGLVAQFPAPLTGLGLAVQASATTGPLLGARGTARPATTGPHPTTGRLSGARGTAQSPTTHPHQKATSAKRERSQQ